MHKVLLVDDDVTFCLILKTWLTKRGYEVSETHSFKEAVNILDTGTFDIMLSDIRLPDEDGINLLKRAKAKSFKMPVILMTGYADIRTAVLSIKLGAFDYVSKPVIPEDMLEKIEKAIKASAASEKPASVQEVNIDDNIEGTSGEARKLYEHISLVAPTNMSVLICGESGSGKEYIARLIHKLSKRRNAPFVAVDCGAIPKDIAASEFFGHIKGSFTGAIGDKTGYFVMASGGTIFFDEIGNLSYEIQVQLLRALEERKIRPVGGAKEISFDVRIIAATNENLHKAVSEGSFREDLYHRINEFSLNALPVRERKEDIPVFANHFLDISNKELEKEVAGFEDEVMRIFRKYPWPGNLREMRNVIKRATLLCRGKFISIADIPEELCEQQTEAVDLSEKRLKNEIDLIKEALQKCNNNKSEAARLLKIDRKTLYNKLKSYGIE